MNLNPALRRQLSAEFVLGTLRGAARKRFAKYLPQDALLQQEVEQWERTLLHMSRLRPVAPSPEVWQAIERATQPVVLPAVSAVSAVPAALPVAANDRFWQAWAGFASVAALVLGLGWYRAENRPLPVPEALPYVSTLQQDQAQWLVSLSPEKGQMKVAMAGVLNLAPQKSLELWILLPDGPRSLGLLPTTGEMQVVLPASLLSQLAQQGSLTLAVSREPVGGSKTGKPTGPVLLTAPAMRVI
jgi:anti-sigma-K factor RskA